MRVGQRPFRSFCRTETLEAFGVPARRRPGDLPLSVDLVADLPVSDVVGFGMAVFGPALGPTTVERNIQSSYEYTVQYYSEEDGSVQTTLAFWDHVLAQRATVASPSQPEVILHGSN